MRYTWCLLMIGGEVVTSTPPAYWKVASVYDLPMRWLPTNGGNLIPVSQNQSSSRDIIHVQDCPQYRSPHPPRKLKRSDFHIR